MISMTGVYFRDVINMVLVGQVSELVENINIEIYSGTINVINLKLCMMVLFIELYLFIPLSVTLTIFHAFWFDKNFNIVFWGDAVEGRSFKLRVIVTCWGSSNSY